MCKIAEAHRQVQALIALHKEQKVNRSLVLLALEVANNTLLEALAENQPKTATSLSHERLLEVLAYDPKTGHFYWRHGSKRGLRAGYLKNDGYRLMVIDGVNYRASRVAWFYVYGVWPEKEIDHINKIKDDDRIKNLRDVNRYIQGRNLNFDNPWGMPGVVKTRRGYRVEFHINGKKKSFGTYDDQYKAVKVCRAKRKAHGVELG